MDFPEHQAAPETERTPGEGAGAATREVNLIFDPTALTLGLGNVTRWLDAEQFQKQLQDQTATVAINLYLPSYTLRELQYQSRGPPVGSTQAKQALKLIDRIIEREYGAEPRAEAPLKYNLFVEDTMDHIPRWERCLPYQVAGPDAREAPRFAGHPSPGPESEMPPRLRNLLRSCLYLARFKDKNKPATNGLWRLVTEDRVATVWAQNFGLDYLNINEAELLITQGKDLSSFEIPAPGADFFAGTDKYDEPPVGHLHTKVDTTSYNYEPLRSRRGRRKAPRAPAEPVVTRAGDDLLEDFDKINFAPRQSTTQLVASTLLAPKKVPKPKENNKKVPKPKASNKKATDARRPNGGKGAKNDKREKKAANSTKCAAAGAAKDTPKDTPKATGSAASIEPQ